MLSLASRAGESLVMQSENGAQFSNITFLLVLFTVEPAASVFGTVTVPLASVYASL